MNAQNYIETDKNSKVQNIINSLEEFMGEINDDKFCMMEGTLSKAKFEFWEKVHQARKNKTDAQNFVLGQKSELDARFLRLAINSYIHTISKLDSIDNFLKVALRVNDNLLLDVDAWVELKDEDELAERDITLATANFNTKIQNLGYYFNLMVVEESDNIEIPEGFDLLDLSELRS